MKRAFKGEIKSVFHHCQRAFIEANNFFLFGRQEPDFNKQTLELVLKFLFGKMPSDLDIFLLCHLMQH